MEKLITIPIFDFVLEGFKYRLKLVRGTFPAARLAEEILVKALGRLPTIHSLKGRCSIDKRLLVSRCRRSHIGPGGITQIVHALDEIRKIFSRLAFRRLHFCEVTNKLFRK